MLILTTGCITGCKEKKKDLDSQPAETSLEGVALKILVVDDQPIATAVKQTRGEWLAQTGSKLTVEEIGMKDLRAKSKIDADAIICPSHMIGELAERDLIAPLPKTVLDENRDQWQSIFELQRRHESVWGDSPIAVPFGSPVLICYCRTDILKHLDTPPPRTWAEYDRLVKLLAERKNLGKLAPPPDQPWHATVEPLAPGWAGVMLLARAAPLAKHVDNYSTLFDIKTMRPLISGPPFVRALQQMVDARSDDSAPLTHDPATARKAFWKGQCALAVTWPTAADNLGDDDNKTNITCTPIELPGSQEVYNVDELRWSRRDRRDEIHVPLLATAGRMGMIVKESQNHSAAARLLVWLSGREPTPPVGSRSPDTTLYSLAQLSSPRQWVESQMSSDAAHAYADLAEKIFDRQQWLFALRIPGRAEYLSALDEAVQQSLAQGKSPQQSLHEAAVKWRTITERLGKENQRRAYRKSLELTP
ncbi:MAG: extracellular solute-binding protein [Pirellulales bacterium]|nr:extracellular solute-binding protein [Pirellulales bacterium]